jgi:membrane-associated phospholipid phosphatase
VSHGEPIKPSRDAGRAVKPADAVLRAAAWPGESPQGHFLPVVVAAFVGVVAGPRAGLWQLAAWAITPFDDVVKRIVNRPRPFPGRFNPVGGMSQDPSFPSSHVSAYVVTFGFASWILHRRRSPATVPASILGLGLVGLIGPSRVHTGDHRWSDVAGGYLLGAACLGALIALARRDRRLEPRPTERPLPVTADRPEERSRVAVTTSRRLQPASARPDGQRQALRPQLAGFWHGRKLSGPVPR